MIGRTLYLPRPIPEADVEEYMKTAKMVKYLEERQVLSID